MIATIAVIVLALIVILLCCAALDLLNNGRVRMQFKDTDWQQLQARRDAWLEAPKPKARTRATVRKFEPRDLS